MGQKSKIIAFAILPFIVGCAADAQLQSLSYLSDDKQRRTSGIASDIICQPEQTCATHYVPSPINLENVHTLGDNIAGGVEGEPNDGITAEQRNRIQTLLMMHSDQACSIYRNNLMGVQVGSKVAQKILPEAITLITKLIDSATGKTLLQGFSAAFSGANGILESETFGKAIMVDKLKSVVDIKNKMRKQIMVAQFFPTLNDDDEAKNEISLTDSKGTEIKIKVEGTPGYSLVEAIADAKMYHRTCDVSELIIGNTDANKAADSLFASKFVLP